MPNPDEPVKIHAYALRARYQPYYQIMKNTAQILGVQDETLQDNQNVVFHWDHVIRLFLQNHCSQGPVQMLTQPSTKFPAIRAFSQLLDETLERHEDISVQDKNVWRHLTSESLR